eukprot:3348644-Alexandrium_andersonii.AAC.1
MSASLVGSEMCIRDRIKRTPLAKVPGQLNTLILQTILTAGGGREVEEACLLYTSDAADDM